MNVLITGASRGIGLAMVNYCIEKNWRVFACCRNHYQAEQLLAIAQLSKHLVSVHMLDVSELATIQALAYELRNEKIDVLINNAGTYGPDKNSFGNVDVSGWLDSLMINTIAPLKMAEAFIEQLSMGSVKCIASISSKMASMDDNGSGGSYIYRSSKAALNSVVKSMAIDLREKGFTCVALHPGWVKTDMGGENAEISTRESVSKMFDIIENLKAEDNGRFIDIDGATIKW